MALKDIKTKPSGRTPRILSDAARAPKELTRKSLLQAHEKAKGSGEPPQQHETPTAYAENRIEYAAADITHRSMQAAGIQGKRITNKIKEARRQQRIERGTDNPRSSFSYEGSSCHTADSPISADASLCNDYWDGGYISPNGNPPPQRLRHSGLQAQNPIRVSAAQIRAYRIGKGDARRSDPQVYQSENGPRHYADSSMHGSSIETPVYRAGRERVRASFIRRRHIESSLRQSMQHAEQVTQAPGCMEKGTIKTAEHSVKTVQTAIKTLQNAAKPAPRAVHTTQSAIHATQQTAHVTQRAAQAAAKVAQTTVRVAREAVKTTSAAAKSAMKILMAIIKGIIAATKALVASIAAGGWAAAIIIIVVALIAFILCTAFGVFFSNESQEGKPMTETIHTINADFHASIKERITEITAEVGADFTEVIFEGDTESLDSVVQNWADVIGVYAVKSSMDDASPADVMIVTPENIEKLEKVFKDMNTVSFRTETETEYTTVTDAHGNAILDGDGNPEVETTVTLYIYVNVTSMDYRDGAALCRFNTSQNEMLGEMMLPGYYPLFAELLGDVVGDGGEYGMGLDVIPNLAPNSLGAQIIAAAKKYIGRSYSSMDCSGLIRAAYRDCGLNSMNGLTSAGMAQKCQSMGVLFTDPSQLQAGDLIFFARKDASRGPGYCTDHNRCGSGPCKRWMQIHHVAIYINETYLIDSTGGNNSVQIRRHWGVNGFEWKWVCFGRPTK